MKKDVNKKLEANGPQPASIHEFLLSKPEVVKNKRSDSEVVQDIKTFTEAVKNYNESKAKLVEEQPLQEQPIKTSTEVEKNSITAQDIAEFDNSTYADDLIDRLNNNNIRKSIEAKLKPLNFEDLLIHGEVRQEIVIRPDFSIVLRSIKPGEDLAVKKLMYGMVGSQTYITGRFSVMNLALSLVSVNGQAIPPHLDQSGKFDEEFFNKKLEKLLWNYSAHIVRFMIINYVWFQDRVDKCISESVDKLGNG